jgi:hypothetical protein
MDNQQTTTTDLAHAAPQDSHVATTVITPEAMAQILEQSTELEKKEVVVTMTAEYIELEKPSESFRGVFIGFQPFTPTDKNTGEIRNLKAARFVINKQVFINAGAVLVSELERAAVPAGTPLEVTYDRKEGNTKIYSIALLG